MEPAWSRLEGLWGARRSAASPASGVDTLFGVTVSPTPLPELDHSFVRELDGLYQRWQPSAVPEPELLVLNEALATELGFDPDFLRSDDGVAMLAGNRVPDGAQPVAQAYAGHQFGGYSPRLGDGRALLLGEVIDVHGRRRDLHMKGSGRTPFARGGDGKAAVGPMLREHVIGEAMYALGIPTTRALAVVATGEQVFRESMLPGAVLTRVAASHLRVGTFQFASATGDDELLRRLADHAIDRHHPAARDAEHPYLALFDAVLDAHARLVAGWMLVGFIHGVMNTDNTTISGETIDYGPCAFMDAFDPATVYSSIDHAGRYAYGNQPSMTMWNLARLAEAMLPLVDDDVDAAVQAVTEVLGTFPERHGAAWNSGMRAKLGLESEQPGDADLVVDLVELLRAERVDMTGWFRALSEVAGTGGGETRARAMVTDVARFDAWVARWQLRLAAEGREPSVVATGMDDVNPVYVPRNHLVEAALDAATGGDLEPFHRLVDVVSRPFDERPGLEAYAQPAPAEFGASYQTFCGT